MNSQRIENIQKELLDSFAIVSNGINNTLHGFTDFTVNTEPYITFFFANKSDTKSFLRDVINPSEQSLDIAITSAVSIMNNDSLAHSDVRSSLSNIRTMQQSVSDIVDMLDHIEMYSMNTIVVSARAGDDGHALSTISSEMARLSQTGSTLSLHITDNMESLLNSLVKFDSMSNQVEFLHESSLTSIKLSSDSIFKRLKEQFELLTIKVSDEYATITSLTQKLGTIKEKFQHEDIVRQNIEKIVFALQEYESSQFVVDNESEGNGVLLHMLAGIKLSEIKSDIDTMRNEISAALDIVVNSMNDFSVSIESGGTSSHIDTTGAFTSILDRLTDLENKFQSYFNVIIQEKDGILEFLAATQNEIREFGSFFDDITAIAKKFKTVILLTSIEMARHDSLKTLLGGSLTDVRQIPDRITGIVAEGQSRYIELNSNLDESIRRYKERYTEQKRVLAECIDTIRKVAVRIKDSESIYDRFMTDSLNKISEVKLIVESTSNCLDTFTEKGHVLSNELESPPATDKQIISDQYSAPLSEMYSFYRNPSRSGDYKSMMLSSLAGEFMKVKTAVSAVEFF
jgi:hypothetical protein